MARLQGVKVIDMVDGEVTKITYEGEEYAKVEDGKPAEGDIGLRTKGSRSWAKVGEYYPIVEIGSETAFAFKDEDGESLYANPNRFDFFRKISAPTLEQRVSTLETKVSALEGEQEDGQVIAGNPQVGDKIRIVIADSPLGTYKNGDIFTISEVGTWIGRNAVRVKEHETSIYRYEFEIIHRPSKPKLKVGDYAKVVEHHNDIYFAGLDGHAPVGDIVKVVETTHTQYEVKELDGGNYDGNPFVKKEGLVKATDEEVAEAKRKQAEKEKEAKWAKIGRKVGEYKEGDIVNYVGLTQKRFRRSRRRTRFVLSR